MNEKLKKELRKLIRRFFEEGTPDQLVLKNMNEDLRRIMKKYGAEADFRADYRALLRETQDELERIFRDRHTGGAYELREANATLNNIIRTSQEGFKRIDRAILRGVMLGIEEGIKGDLGWRDTARVALRKLKMKEHHIETEITTMQAALDNTMRFADFSVAGSTHLRYSGPSGTTRPFCMEHINKIYPIEEVRKMINGFNQPAFVFCGGYNCRHRWVPVGEANISPFGPDQELKFRSKDLEDDSQKHMQEFGISDRFQYEKEAIMVAKSPRALYAKKHKDVFQHILTGVRGMVVADHDGTIRGYYFHENISITEKAMEDKKIWKKIR